MIKVISFDIGGTLIKFEDNSPTKKYDLKNLSSLINLPYESVKIAYKNVFQKTIGSFRELVEIFCKLLNIGVTNELIDFFKKKFNLEGSINTIDEKDINVIKRLKDSGYKVILFSNSCCLLNETIDKNISQMIDGIFYSYKLGYTKNESESYKLIERYLECDSNEFLHIGDTLEADYNVPIQNGWNALYYGISDNKNVKSINSLDEIFDFLEEKRYNM